MLNRNKAIEILHENMQSINLRRHCYAVEAVMKALASHFGENEEKWGIVGLLHDGDYEKTKSIPEKHTILMHEILINEGERDNVILNAILSHNYAHTGQNKPKNRMEWALYTCDELTGFIVAVALVRPDKKLKSVTVDSILKKWNVLHFAAGVNRKQIELCEEKLGIKLKNYIEIALMAMKNIAGSLNL
jgi:hypothetical protein